MICSSERRLRFMLRSAQHFGLTFDGLSHQCQFFFSSELQKASELSTIFEALPGIKCNEGYCTTPVAASIRHRF
jgi:hypothetical protein